MPSLPLRHGWLNSSDAIELGKLYRDFSMDDVGAPVIDKINTVSTTIEHAVNATNEATEIDVPNVAGDEVAVWDGFSSSISPAWGTLKGTFAINLTKLKATALDGTYNIASNEFDAQVGDASFTAKVAVPTGGSADQRAGILLGFDGQDGYAVLIEPDDNRFSIAAVSRNGAAIGRNLISVPAPINHGTEYTITVVKRQGTIEAWLGTASSTRISYSNRPEKVSGRIS